MAIHVTCPQCKKQVPFGRLFCTFCGSKLELSPEKVSSRLTAREAMSGAKRWAIRLFSLAVVASVIGVFFWPMKPMGEVGNAAAAASCEQRIQSMRARTLNGIIFIEKFPEAEVNAWLRREVSKMREKGAGGGFQLAEVNVDFRQGIVVVNTRLELSKAQLSYEVELAPAIRSQGFEHPVRALKIGHVPMPSFAAEYLAGRALNIFSGLREEAEMLGKMKQMEVADGVVRVSNQPR